MCGHGYHPRSVCHDAFSGFQAHLRLIPEHKVAIIVLTNADDTMPHEYTHRAMHLLVPAVTRATNAATPVAAIDPACARYAGRYRGDWGDVQVLLTDRGLEVIAPLADDPMQGRITLTPVAEHTFRMTGNDPYDAPGELLTFEVAAGWTGGHCTVRHGADLSGGDLGSRETLAAHSSLGSRTSAAGLTAVAAALGGCLRAGCDRETSRVARRRAGAAGLGIRGGAPCSIS